LKKLLLLITLFTLYTHHSNSQWLQQTLPVSGTMNDMQFINANTGWITFVSPFNFIKTTNSGTNWTVLYANNPQFGKIKFFNDTLGYSIGRDASFNGMISRTTNGGLNWVVMQLTSRGYTSMDFVNPDTG
jgi:photosystem II stability/assembly factor-like uncharacterized protein